MIKIVLLLSMPPKEDIDINVTLSDGENATEQERAMGEQLVNWFKEAVKEAGEITGVPVLIDEE